MVCVCACVCVCLYGCASGNALVYVSVTVLYMTHVCKNTAHILILTHTLSQPLTTSLAHPHLLTHPLVGMDTEGQAGRVV